MLRPQFWDERPQFWDGKATILGWKGHNFGMATTKKECGHNFKRDLSQILACLLAFDITIPILGWLKNYNFKRDLS